MAVGYKVTCTAPVNIAVIKYWGKRNVPLNLPTNDSLSLTLSKKALCTTTTVELKDPREPDLLILNGDCVHLSKETKLAQCIQRMRQARTDWESENAPNDAIPLSKYSVCISTTNNFPTAAGLASSASGFACLVYTLAKVYQLPWTSEQLSIVARQGSGSACRSLYGGFVKWDMGQASDGSDSCAVQVAPCSHWPSLLAVILVVNDAKKDVGSTEGMQRTVASSSLFQHRIHKVVSERMKQIEKAILEKDFPSFAQLTMKDSNQFHAVCMDSYPPIFYLSDTSRHIINMIHSWNDAASTTMAAYTFDAGPNAVIYLEQSNLPMLLNLVNSYFPPSPELANNYIHDPCEVVSALPTSASCPDLAMQPRPPGALKRVLVVPMGEGPEQISNESVV